MRLEWHVDIHRPADEVWAYLANYANDSAWRAGVTIAQEPAGMVHDGATTCESLRVMGSTFVTECELFDVVPGKRFRFRPSGAKPKYRGHGWREVLPAGDGSSRVQFGLHFEGIGINRLMDPLTGRIYRRRFAADIARLKAILEDPARKQSAQTAA